MIKKQILVLTEHFFVLFLLMKCFCNVELGIITKNTKTGNKREKNLKKTIIDALSVQQNIIQDKG